LTRGPTVARDHDGGKDRVPGQRRNFRAAASHQCHDQRHLDDGDSDRQHQRREWLADPMGDHLGVVDRRDNGAGQAETDEDLDRW
jgi:hypothetical protein